MREHFPCPGVVGWARVGTLSISGTFPTIEAHGGAGWPYRGIMIRRSLIAVAIAVVAMATSLAAEAQGVPGGLESGAVNGRTVLVDERTHRIIEIID